MQRNIYRFKIAAGTNGIFDAVDEVDGSAVTLYEWTPDEKDFESYISQLQDTQSNLAGAEVFTDAASLYLVARSKEEARTALQQLARHNLFTGNWPGISQPPPPPPQAQAAPLSAPKPKSRAPLVFALLLIGFIASAIAFAIGANSANDNLARERAEAAQARDDAERLQNELSGKEKVASDEKTKREQLEQAEQQHPHLIRLENHCNQVIDVAIHYQSLENQDWLTEGWWKVEASQTKTVATIAAWNGLQYYVYAESEGTPSFAWYGDHANGALSKPIEVVSNAFVHIADSQIFGNNLRTVNVYLQSFSPRSDYGIPFYCQQ